MNIQANQEQRPYLNEQELAKLTGLSVATWRRYRATGQGPAYIKLANRLMYKIEDVTKWLDDRKVTSTAEYEPHQKGRVAS